MGIRQLRRQRQAQAEYLRLAEAAGNRQEDATWDARSEHGVVSLYRQDRLMKTWIAPLDAELHWFFSLSDLEITITCGVVTYLYADGKRWIPRA